MTKENWDALLFAMRRDLASPNCGSFTMSNLEAEAVLRELEVLGGSDFLTITPPKPRELERAR